MRSLVPRHSFNAGLTLGLLLWFLAFLTVGGEWFLMWQSSKWNGLGPALRMFTVMGFVLLILNLPEDPRSREQSWRQAALLG